MDQIATELARVITEFVMTELTELAFVYVERIIME